MAMPRSFLEELGIEEDKIAKIVQANADSLEYVTSERDKLRGQLEDLQKQISHNKATNDKVAALEAEIATLKAAADKAGTVDYEQKYNDLKAQSDSLQAEYDQFKADVEAKETTAKKREAYKGLLKEAGVSDRRMDAVLKVADIDKIEFNKDGSVRESDKLVESIKTEWSDFIEHEGTQGAETITPPTNNGGAAQTKEQIMAIKDTAERQKAMIENHEVFGF